MKLPSQKTKRHNRTDEHRTTNHRTEPLNPQHRQRRKKGQNKSRLCRNKNTLKKTDLQTIEKPSKSDRKKTQI